MAGVLDNLKGLLSGDFSFLVGKPAEPAPAGFGATQSEDPYKYAKIRNALPQSGDDPLQRVAAPLEHREFVEGFVAEHPLIGPPAAAVSTLGYYAKKKLTPEGLRAVDETPASIDQVFAAFEGIGRGIKANLNKPAAPTALAGGTTRKVAAIEPAVGMADYTGVA